MVKKILIALLVLIAAVSALFVFRVSRAVAPADFGSGLAFEACALSKPNCVSSLNQENDFYIAPFAASGSADEIRTKLLRAIQSEARAEVVFDQGEILEVTFRTALFRFPDDARFRIDAANSQVLLRSQSRVGHSDLGVNRKRLERIRAAIK